MIGSAVWLAALWALGDAHASGDGREISRSRGKRDGLVVLWPRIVPETEDPTVVGLAERLQVWVEAAASPGVEPSRVDVRPPPERSCPQAGCRAASIGLMLGHEGGGCVVVAVVGAPGATPPTVLPMAGQVEMVGDSIPFRTPPEQRMIVREFVPCGQVEATLDPAALASLVQQARTGGL